MTWNSDKTQLKGNACIYFLINVIWIFCFNAAIFFLESPSTGSSSGLSRFSVLCGCFLHSVLYYCSMFLYPICKHPLLFCGDCFLCMCFIQVSQPLQYNNEQVAALILPTLNQLYTLRSLVNSARNEEWKHHGVDHSAPKMTRSEGSTPSNQSDTSLESDEKKVVVEEEMHATLRYRITRWVFTVLCIMFGLFLLLFTLVRNMSQNTVCTEVCGDTVIHSSSSQNVPGRLFVTKC